jgi:cephalosporin hydroxylase
MLSFYRRIDRKLRTLMNPSQPNPYDFATEVSDEHRSAYSGRAAEIFFSNQGKPVAKWLHYLPIYDQLLEKYIGTKVKMLEIGVAHGGSLGLWRKLLGSDAVIFGIDINPECAAFDGDSGSVRIGSQDDPEFLRKVVAEMKGLNVVLDDGSHIGRHQRASFDVLFPLVEDGGLYMIEDVCSSYWPHWEGGRKRRGTIIEFLKDKVDDLHIHYQKMGLNNAEDMTNIESIQFFDSLVAIRKHRQLPKYHAMVPPSDELFPVPQKNKKKPQQSY